MMPISARRVPTRVEIADDDSTAIPSTTWPTFGGVVVEQPDEVKALVLKAAVAKERPGQIADADEHRPPGPVDPERPTNGGREPGGVVTNAALTEMAKGRQVPADLRGTDPHRLGQFDAGNGPAIPGRRAQTPQILAQSLGRRPGKSEIRFGRASVSHDGQSHTNRPGSPSAPRFSLSPFRRSVN
jgi:hypothetical protein